jgi:hypothetical protein
LLLLLSLLGLLLCAAVPAASFMAVLVLMWCTCVSR